MAMVTFVITAALVANIAIDCVITLVTFVTKFRYVPVDTFALMIADVTSAHYWLPWLPRHSEVFCPAHVFLTCQILFR
jgi:hypothetical protein